MGEGVVILCQAANDKCIIRIPFFAPCPLKGCLWVTCSLYIKILKSNYNYIRLLFVKNVKPFHFGDFPSSTHCLTGAPL